MYSKNLSLQAPSSLMLKLGYNTTRPAPWDSRLGFQQDPRPLCVPITGLSGEGGMVGAMDAVVVRKYPVMVSILYSLIY